MRKIILLILELILCLSCCESSNSSIDYNISYTHEYKRINVKDEYKVFGYDDYIRVYVFDIDGHEYIGNPSIEYFIHSPNCKCHKKLCTSSDLLSQPSWY